MEYVNNYALQNQDIRKKMMLAGAKDGVITILWVVEGFQLIDHVEFNQLIDCIHKLRQAGDADNAVELALFITDADDHSLFSDGTHFQGLQFKFVENFHVKFSHLFGGDEGCFQEIPSVVLKNVLRPGMAKYARKYMQKETMRNYTASPSPAAL
ncbi:hypothetical protein [Glaciimonas immobilis]|uniref:Uncharacterized protein n=1 Tax=Glaciimonas immobilis TaxID=728004 RepID=A0A840RLL8_9BURK|nr:hypothetical protein [Glaciimonas immobilis]KAF3999197.1 hypothetical protein HAV38_04470 [Glaciimonas immobilis]MBB5198653.1 hypothetical protein [Glaciimonas immobilis]